MSLRFIAITPFQTNSVKEYECTNNVTDILIQVHESRSLNFHSEIALVKGKKKYIYDSAHCAGYHLNTVSANDMKGYLNVFLQTDHKLPMHELVFQQQLKSYKGYWSLLK